MNLQNKISTPMGVLIILVAAVIFLGGSSAYQFYATKGLNDQSHAQLNNSANAPKTQTAKKTNASNNNAGQTKGTMYFTITDGETTPAGNITAINMVIDKVQTYNEAYGWVTVSQVPQTFNLLQLKTSHQILLLAKASVPANKYEVPQNTYNDFRIHIAKVTVTDSGNITAAILPANNFDIKTTGLFMYTNTNSAAQFNVMGVKSLHKTDKGEFVFTPVITFDSRVNATVQVGSNNVTMVSFGETNASVNAGMDINGQIKTDFMVNPAANITVTNGIIQINSAAKP